MRQTQLSPDESEAIWREAVGLKGSSKERDHKKAINLVLSLIRDGANNPDITSTLKCFIADVYCQNLNDYDNAVEYYLKALEEDPNNSLAGSNLGAQYLLHEDYEAAVQILEQTLNRGISSTFIRESTKDWLVEARQKLTS